MKMNNLIINKTMDYEDLKLKKALIIIKELNDLIDQIQTKKLKISSWYGTFNINALRYKILGFPHDSFEVINRGYNYKKIDSSVDDKNFPWFLYWEIIWVVLNSDFQPGQKVLDLGGCSSLFSYYLASKDLDVTTLDIQSNLVDNANNVSTEMGWELKNYKKDMRELNFNEKFDHITSICVYEHIPMYDRIIINKNIKDLLNEGGKYSITFDYRNSNKKAFINSPEDINEQFIIPSGLQLRGNKHFFDSGKNYLLSPFYYKKRIWIYKIAYILTNQYNVGELFKVKNFNDYTFAALFLSK